MLFGIQYLALNLFLSLQIIKVFFLTIFSLRICRRKILLSAQTIDPSSSSSSNRREEEFEAQIGRLRLIESLRCLGEEDRDIGGLISSVYSIRKSKLIPHLFFYFQENPNQTGLMEREFLGWEIYEFSSHWELWRQIGDERNCKLGEIWPEYCKL